MAQRSPEEIESLPVPDEIVRVRERERERERERSRERGQEREIERVDLSKLMEGGLDQTIV
jgi:hypothetical protein